MDEQQKKRWLLAAVGAALVLLAVARVAWWMWPDPVARTDQTFYTADDGQTLFPDSIYRVAPFEHDGAEAVMAYIFSYDGGSKEMVGYLGKYTPQAKAKLDATIAQAQAEGRSPNTVALYGDRNFLKNAILVKKPGDAEWVPLNSAKGRVAQSVTAPDGSEVDSVYVY